MITQLTRGDNLQTRVSKLVCSLISKTAKIQCRIDTSHTFEAGIAVLFPA